MVIFIACVSMRLVGAMGDDGESVKVMLFFTYVSRPSPDLDCLSFVCELVLSIVWSEAWMMVAMWSPLWSVSAIHLSGRLGLQ